MGFNDIRITMENPFTPLDSLHVPMQDYDSATALRHDEGFKALKEKITKERGVDTTYYKDNYLARRFLVRMRARKCDSVWQYMQILDEDPGEWAHLLDRLTINVTEFFRNPRVWKVFQAQVLPEVFREEKKGVIVRFWSAGCSSGEEAYSIAITVNEYLKMNGLAHHIVVRGSDLDDRSLANAKAGIYKPEALRKATPAVREEYFRYDPAADRYRVSDELRTLVRFNRYDLTSMRRFRFFDVIFCRNVIIYIDRKQQMEMFSLLYDALNKGGFLILGKTESLFGKAKSMFEPVDGSERIYRKARI